ncbi:MAG: radical SAM protein [Deltaproteobacteria bacterium]|nr:radical SAM protein [Deltaproteobacteria bacterium]
MSETESLFMEAWRLSRAAHGFDLTIYQPGMFVIDGRRGAYHAVSITGTQCALDCDHCGGQLLKNMRPAMKPGDLIDLALKAAGRGDQGILISGGCDEYGSLPWSDFITAIEQIKNKTNLIVTVHTGQVDIGIARAFSNAGVDQALIDVIGDDATAREIFHLKDGIAPILRSMDALFQAGLEVVPHILYGIHYGKEKGEHEALEIICKYPLRKYVVVVITPLKGTRMSFIEVPSPKSVASFIAEARLMIPEAKCSLGCARPGGKYRKELDLLALRAGINSLAIGSDHVIKEAEKLGLNVIQKSTCCSLN